MNELSSFAVKLTHRLAFFECLKFVKEFEQLLIANRRKNEILATS